MQEQVPEFVSRREDPALDGQTIPRVDNDGGPAVPVGHGEAEEQLRRELRRVHLHTVVLEEAADVANEGAVELQLPSRYAGRFSRALLPLRTLGELLPEGGQAKRVRRDRLSVNEQALEVVVVVDPPRHVGEQVAAGGHLLVRAKTDTLELAYGCQQVLQGYFQGTRYTQQGVHPRRRLAGFDASIADTGQSCGIRDLALGLAPSCAQALQVRAQDLQVQAMETS